ncbi:O-antigen/teichoic acid export membrane protein [Paenibacillus qinlingensis]|uniref:O-antigen/teichoic acid export membrane protein n=1 Tax=Paenibacillus qinlingensis TaxID=1837343 RepID=A0ABU1P2B2_9BACL|nr:O-antigen/teichoic acid export membrane protein [Paenibacillus qinlingensis]
MDQFMRKVVILARGTVLSQVIILATLPILTRLYSPSDFGIFSVYISIISIVLVIVSLSYEIAIPLPENDRMASSIVKLSLYLCVIISIVGGLGFYLLHTQFSRWLDEPDMQRYAFLFTFSLFGAGCHQILNLWSIRKEYFKQLSRTKYMQSISQVSSQLLLSFTSWGPLGLIIGELLGRLTGVTSQWRLWRNDVKKKAIQTTWLDMKDSAHRYRRFPILSSWSNILNSVGLYLPNIILAALYGPYIAGLYTMGQRFLGAPITLISLSINQVYMSEFAMCLNQNPSRIHSLFRSTVKKSLVFGIIIIGGVVIFAPMLFHYLFGDTWEKSGHFMRILSIMYLSQFIATSVGATLSVMERQDLHLYREITRIVMILGALFLARYTNQTSDIAITFLSIASTLGYSLHLSLSWFAVKKMRKIKGSEYDAGSSSSSNSRSFS